jgi:hypothetical protein
VAQNSETDFFAFRRFQAEQKAVKRSTGTRYDSPSGLIYFSGLTRQGYALCRVCGRRGMSVFLRHLPVADA